MFAIIIIPIFGILSSPKTPNWVVFGKYSMENPQNYRKISQGD
jgi:hypothetical protein